MYWYTYIHTFMDINKCSWSICHHFYPVVLTLNRHIFRNGFQWTDSKNMALLQSQSVLKVALKNKIHCCMYTMEKSYTLEFGTQHGAMQLYVCMEECSRICMLNWKATERTNIARWLAPIRPSRFSYKFPLNLCSCHYTMYIHMYTHTYVTRKWKVKWKYEFMKRSLYTYIHLKICFPMIWNGPMVSYAGCHGFRRILHISTALFTMVICNVSTKFDRGSWYNSLIEKHNK